MTQLDFEQLTPREIDTQVALALGYEIGTPDGLRRDSWFLEGIYKCPVYGLPPWSTSNAQAFELWDEITKLALDALFGKCECDEKPRIYRRNPFGDVNMLDGWIEETTYARLFCRAFLTLKGVLGE